MLHVSSKLAIQAKECREPVNMQKRAHANITPNHLIPLASVPKRITQTAIRSIDVTKVSKSYNEQVVSRNLGLGGPGTQHGNGSKQQIHIQDCECHNLGLWRERRGGHGISWYLVGIELERIVYSRDIGPYSVPRAPLLVAHRMARVRAW